MVYGGGFPELRMAKAVDELASKTPGKKSLAMESFARALRALPATICDNAGLDSSEIVANLRAAHGADPTSRMGVDVVRGEAGDMSELGIFEAFRVKHQVRCDGPPFLPHWCDGPSPPPNLRSLPPTRPTGVLL